MPNQESRNADLTIKIIGLILSALGIIGVIASIYFGFKSQVHAIDNQWGQEFYKQKMNVYLKASEAASKIAYLKKHNIDSVQLEKNIFEFNTLYGGPMAILEESEVEIAMVLYKQGLDENISPSGLQNLALYLSHVLRNESRAAFLNEETPTSTYGDNKKLLNKMKAILENR